MGFYAYIYSDPRDGSPFYVGKGKGGRSHAHLKKRGPNRILINKIKQIEAAGIAPNIVVISCETEEAAFNLERTLITALGRRDQSKGTLLNYTDGGQGSSGRTWFRHSEETKERIRQSSLGRRVSEETKARISAANKGRAGPSEEQKLKMREASRSPEARRKNSETQKRIFDPVRHAEMTRRAAEANRGRKASAETRRKMSEAVKKRTISDATRQRMSEAQRRRYAK